MNMQELSAAGDHVTEIKPSRGWTFPDLFEVWERRELIHLMMTTSIKSKYRQSLLSLFYVFLQPLMSVGVFTVIFNKIAGISGGPAPYALFSFLGVLSWNYFNRLVNESNSSLVSLQHLLTKIYIPRLTILIVPVGTQLLEFCIGFSLLAVFFAYFEMVPSWRIIFVPLIVAVMSLFALSISLWLSNINVTFRDVSMLLPATLQVLFYATPIVYPSSMVPERFQTVYWLNPIATIVETLRWSVLTDYSAPALAQVVYSLVLVCFLFFTGLVIFERFSRSAADRV